MNPEIKLYDPANWYQHPDIPAHKTKTVLTEKGVKFVTEIKYPETPEYGVVVTTTHDPLTMYTIEKVTFDLEDKTRSGWKPTSMTYVTDVDEYINTSCYVKEDMVKCSDITSLLALRESELAPF